MPKECRSKKDGCEGEVQEYYFSDGGLVSLCHKHGKESGALMTKKYYDEVYEEMEAMIPSTPQIINYVEFFECYTRSVRPRYRDAIPPYAEEIVPNRDEIFAKFLEACPKEWKKMFLRDKYREEIQAPPKK